MEERMREFAVAIQHDARLATYAECAEIVIKELYAAGRKAEGNAARESILTARDSLKLP